jgi:hypothetical protein
MTRGTSRLGHRDRVQAQGPGALYHDGVTELLIDSFQAVHDLRQSAVRAGRDRVGDGVGNGVHNRTGRQQEVIAVAADEERWFVGASEHRHLQVQTCVAPTGQAVAAGVAAEEIRKHHPGADRQRGTVGIGRDAVAEGLDRTHHFVPKHRR